MQISYHSVLTKIQKLQNLKKKKKTLYLYWLVLPEIGRYGRYSFRYETGGVERTGLLVGTVYSGHKLTSVLLASYVVKKAVNSNLQINTYDVYQFQYEDYLTD